jgi:glycosyltransferase involved in cell wall biosynthesis
MLPVAIKSILDQSFSDWELIIVNDGSTDNTEHVIKLFQDDRIKYFYQDNQERCVARNNGVDRAKGKYICFLDSDDYYFPERLERLQFEILKRNEPVAMIYTGICSKREDELIQKVEIPASAFSNNFDFVMRAVIGTSQTCIFREILLKHKFDPQFYIGEDMELWMRIVNEFPIIYFPDQFTVALTDHETRSVNVKNDNVYREVIRVFEYSKKNFHYPFTRKVSNEIYSECYLGIAKYFIYKKKKVKAIRNLLLSLLYDFGNEQFKYKLNIIVNIIFNFTKANELIN